MFTKQLCLCCLNSAFKKCRISGESSQYLINESIREYSSKKSKQNNKNTGKITVTANNDFVAHHLNSSIATHLRRQQGIRDYVQEEERQQQYEAGQKKVKSHEDYKDPKINEKSEHFKRSVKSTNDKKVSKIDLEESELASDSDEYGIEELETPNWDQINLPMINKDFRKVSEITQNRCTAEIDEYRKKSQIKVSSDVEKPLFKFNELNDQSETIVNVLERNGFIDCTPIQAQGLPIALSGADLLAVSQSGYNNFQ